MHFGKTVIILKRGDITSEEVDIIVNSANSLLAGGGGVDGAIHQAGGPEVASECERVRRERGRCPTGSAVLTKSGLLPSKYLIHAVGPVWRGGHQGEEALLKSAYRHCLDLARSVNARSIAFPSISTGIYSFPIELASRIALGEVKQDALERDDLQEVRFVLFSDSDLAIYKKTLSTLL